ncbi:MAG TPA: hypothetical protein VHE61_01050 [Opitutaceae bacterium]|nr:hypothetical protein [Opitutaceae bacterium]
MEFPRPLRRDPFPRVGVPFLRTLAIVAVGTALTARTIGAPAPAASGPVVELPKFVVTDSRVLPPPESWRYAAIPGFEILSNASDRETQRLIADFRLFQEALSVVWPMPAQMQSPVLLILCGSGNRFSRFVPDHTEGDPDTARASVFLKGRTRDAIVIDLQATEISLLPTQIDDPASGVDSSHFSIEHNKVLYREYVRYLLSKSQPRLPAWFEEGMAQIIMAMNFDAKYIEVGRIEENGTVSAAAGSRAQLNEMMTDQTTAFAPSDQSDNAPSTGMAAAADEDHDFNNALAHRALMPMGKLFAVGHDSPEAMNTLGNSVWAKQCYAFVHMGLYGEDGHWQKPFMEFLVRATKQPVTEEMFKECFKMSYNAMGIQLRGYIQGARYRVQQYKLKGEGLQKPQALALRDATQAQVGRIQGEAMMLAGHPDAARNEFIAPYMRGESDPELLAELGLAEHAAGKDDRARKFLTAAVVGKATDPDAYLQLARFHYADALAAPGAPGGQFSAAQQASIERPLVVATTLPPANQEIYELLANTLSRCAARPTHADLVPLVQGVREFPGNLRLVYATAALCADAKEFDAAESLVEYGLKASPDPKTKATFEHLRAALPPVAASGAPASGAPAK